ncbi:hypothetical protein [Winogradskyella forsetii]|uniref:hypothetical protein n=1 Tax=Winogradskyella forsetii TaxID=2686077 RepID=UPI0015BDFE12|nr:hypothetical protein [Winogradskyella forsetii]
MKIYKISILMLMSLLMVNCDSDDDSSNEVPQIDLKAEFILFSVEPTTQFAGTATITGIVKNIGDDFNSGAGQQTISLYERSLGTPTNQSGNLVASLNFETLAANETLEVSYSRPWNSSSPAEGEFPPEYILVISYDPDLFLDGNLNNDDTNTANNEILVSGSLINTMF